MSRKIFVIVFLAFITLCSKAYCYDRNFSYDTPLGSSQASAIDTAIQDFKKSLGERINNDHWFDDADGDINSLTAGDHRQVTMLEKAADPSAETNSGILYTKDDSTDTELFYIDDNGIVTQITQDGRMGGSEVNMTNLSIEGNCTIDGNLSVNGTAKIKGATAIGGTLGVDGDLTIAQDATLEGNLSVSSSKKILHESIIKAWVNFAGSSTINDSFNMTSITDNGVGDFTLTFDEDFSNTKYVVVGTAIATGGGDSSTTLSLKVGTTLAAGACTIVTESDNGGTNVDCNPTMVMAIGR